MKKNEFIVLSFLISVTGLANENLPDYCQENSPKPICKREKIANASRNLSGLLQVEHFLKEKDFKENLKNTALIKLLERKKKLLLPYPEVYSHTDGHKFWDTGLKNLKTSARSHRNQKAFQRHNCIPAESKIKKRLDKMDAAFDRERRDVVNEDFQIKHLSHLLLGAIAAEEGIQKRPQIAKEIEEAEKKIKKLKSKRHQRHNKKVKQNTEKIQDLETEIAHLRRKKAYLDEGIFKDPFYAKPRGLGESMWSRIKEFASGDNKYLLGDYKRSNFLKGSLKKLRRAKGSKFVNDILEAIKHSKQYHKDSGGQVSGIQAGQFALASLLKTNPQLLKEIKSLYLDELKLHLRDLKTSINEICENNGEDLYKISSLVKSVGNELVKNAKAELGQNADLASILNTHQRMHCSLLKKDRDTQILGMSKLTLTQIGSGAVALGAGVATAFGCVPCLGIAITAGGVASGAGMVETFELDHESNQIRGLADIGLANQEKAREAFHDAQAGWAFVGLDIALAPIGLKGGAMWKAGKNISHGRKELKGTELAENKDFLKTLVQGLPEGEYNKIIAKIKDLTPEQQKIITKKLTQLKDLDQAERLTVIARIMKDNSIDFPSGKSLNDHILKKLESNPLELEKIKKDYSEAMLSLSIIKGSPNEETFVRIAGILQNKGCAGFCRTPVVNQEKVMAEYKRLMSKCSIQ